MQASWNQPRQIRIECNSRPGHLALLVAQAGRPKSRRSRIDMSHGWACDVAFEIAVTTGRAISQFRFRNSQSSLWARPPQSLGTPLTFNHWAHPLTFNAMGSPPPLSSTHAPIVQRNGHPAFCEMGVSDARWVDLMCVYICQPGSSRNIQTLRALTVAIFFANCNSNTFK